MERNILHSIWISKLFTWGEFLCVSTKHDMMSLYISVSLKLCIKIYIKHINMGSKWKNCYGLMGFFLFNFFLVITMKNTENYINPDVGLQTLSGCCEFWLWLILNLNHITREHNQALLFYLDLLTIFSFL